MKGGSMKNSELRNTFFKYIFFSILSTLSISVYILADTYFIAKSMGADGLTALNLCLPVFSFINGCGLMLGIGGGSRFSMLYCRTERDETDRIFTNAFWAALAAGLGFLLAGIFFSRPLTRLLGTDSSVFPLAHSYLKTVLLFAPAFVMNNLLVCFLRNDGAPRLAMAGVVISNAANIILDWLFMFRMNMGMRGAALATCIAPLISMAVMSFHFLTGWNAFRLRLTLPKKETVRDIISLGLHTFVTECSGGIVIIVFNYVIYRLCGNIGIAAYGVTANLAIVFTAIFTGLSTGVQPLLCKHHGGSNTEAGAYLLRLSLRTAIIMAVCAYALVHTHCTALVSVFNSRSDAQFRALAENGVRLYFLFMPFMSINAVLSVCFTSCEKPLLSQIVSLLRGILLVVPLAFIFLRMHSMKGIWLTVPIAELLTAVTAAVLYFCCVKPYGVYVYRYVPRRRTRSLRPHSYR